LLKLQLINFLFIAQLLLRLITFVYSVFTQYVMYLFNSLNSLPYVINLLEKESPFIYFVYC